MLIHVVVCCCLGFGASEQFHITADLLRTDSEETDKQQTIQYAFSLADRFKVTGHNATREKCATFYLLLDLSQFQEQFKLGQFDDSLGIMEQLALLPLKPDSTVDSCISQFNTLEEEIRRCLPDIILGTMVCRC